MKTWLSLLLAALLCSFFSGFFINLLMMSADAFQANGRILIWFTPMAGIALYYLGQIKYFKNAEKVNSPASVPYIYLATIWTQLFGASCGREGAAVQIGSAVAEFVRQKLKQPEKLRQIFAHVGVAAAFCMALGTPLSSISFALEYKKHPNRENFLASLFGSAVGFGFMQVFHVRHWFAPSLNVDFSELLRPGFLALWLILWLSAQIFFHSGQFAARLLSWIPEWITLPASGVIFGLSAMMVGGFQFNNFSTNLLDDGFASPASLATALGKLFFTFVCLSGGWKGGAFVPLMVGGGLVASWASSTLALALGPATALGVFSIVALRFDVPLTGALITGEMFGWKIGIAAIPLHLMLKFLRPKINWDKIYRAKNA